MRNLKRESFISYRDTKTPVIYIGLLEFEYKRYSYLKFYYLNGHFDYRNKYIKFCNKIINTNISLNFFKYKLPRFMTNKLSYVKFKRNLNTTAVCYLIKKRL